ncbi:MAG: M23 family metallopeptidase [Treponema sp.]|nr:M23 family metallopeptidase [Treponema sp.]
MIKLARTIFLILFFTTLLALVPAEDNNIPLTEIPSDWPIRNGLGEVTMFFGENTHPITGEIFFHNGIDITTYRFGDAVAASADGQVITAGYDYSLGNHIIIEHNHGFCTLYLHLQGITVHTGQNVRQGEIIGYIGSTGMSLAPHLHFEIHLNSEAVDPLLYIGR